MLGRMDAARAIADLVDVSPQVRAVVIVEPEDAVVGTNAAPDLAERLIASARELLRIADAGRPEPVSQLEAATTTGSVFVVRDGERVIAATTSPEPTVGLVFYDLKSCVRSVDPTAGADDS
jgi:predicted regulator of Ras-like GTPase activity (Roadblock/LC7/MglB family)